MQFSALSVTKFVVSGIVGLGAGKIAKELIKNNIAEPVTLLEKATVLSGAWALGGIVSQAAKGYTNEILDDAFGGVQKLYDDYKLNQKLSRINDMTSTWSDEGLDPKDFRRNPNDKWERIPTEEVVTVPATAEEIVEITKPVSEQSAGN